MVKDFTTYLDTVHNQRKEGTEYFDYEHIEECVDIARDEMIFRFKTRTGENGVCCYFEEHLDPVTKSPSIQIILLWDIELTRK